MDHQVSEEEEICTSEHMDIIPDDPFNIKEEEEPHFMDHQDPERAESIHLPANVPFSIKEEDAYFKDHQNFGGIESTSHPTDIPLSIKEEEAYFMDHQQLETRQSIGSPTGCPVITSVVSLSLKHEEETDFLQETEARERTTGHMAITPVPVSIKEEGEINPVCIKIEEEAYPISIKQEGDTYSIDNQNSEKRKGMISLMGSTASEVSKFELMPDVQGFMFEPERTEEELALRDSQSSLAQEASSDDESTRNDGTPSLDLGSACQCNACIPIPSLAKNYCCHQFPSCQTHLADGTGCRCITEHPDFAAVCLTRGVLKMVMRMVHELRGHGRESLTTNRQYRLTAYRAYTWWTHGRLGDRACRVIPSCVVRLIREQFPSEGEDYTGVKSADEINDAWKV